MKTTIATGGPRIEILDQVVGGRKEALEYLLRRRMTGQFLLICTDREPGQIDMEWLLVAKANSREAAVSYASYPSQFNWAYLDHYDFPRTLRETVTDAVRGLCGEVPDPPETPKIHREAISDSMDMISLKPRRRV